MTIIVPIHLHLCQSFYKETKYHVFLLYKSDNQGLSVYVYYIGQGDISCKIIWSPFRLEVVKNLPGGVEGKVDPLTLVTVYL